MKSSLLFVVCLVAFTSARDYASTPMYTQNPYYSQYFPGNAPFQVPDGASVNQVRLHPYNDGWYYNYDALVIGFDVCYASKLADGSWDLTTQVCSPSRNPTYSPETDTKTLTLDPAEYISEIVVTFANWHSVQVQMSFKTNTGRSIATGGSQGYYSRANMESTYGYQYFDYVNTFDNSDNAFAGFQVGNYYNIYDLWVLFYSGVSGPTCGDGIVSPGEDCDSSSLCCVACKFAPATTVCRPSAGLCDVAESCTGSSEACPTDAYQPKGTACGESFGMCDVLLEESCTGASAQCFPTPTIPQSPLSQIADWSIFNVISFDTFTCNGGDIEGRLAVRNKATLSGFDLGLKINYTTDSFATSSLYSAGDVSWTDGEIHPSNAQAFVGGAFNAPDYLTAHIFNAGSSGFDQSFQDARTYYISIQDQLAAIPTNAETYLIYGDGLHIKCASRSDVYHLQVDASIFNSVNWYSTENCKFSARWIIDITGTGPVSFQGAPFPGIVERVIYNILGSGRTITANNGVAGHLLAPKNSYSQSQGVTYGQVVVGDVIVARQNNKPNCINFKSVVVSARVMKPVTIGDVIIYVSDLSNLIVGDKICVNGDCQTVTDGSWMQEDDGTIVGAVSVSSPFTVNAAANIYATVAVEDPASATRDTPLAPTYPTGGWAESNGALLAVPVLAAVLALVM